MGSGRRLRAEPLPLSVMHKSVQEHRGVMRFASSTREERSGTTFVIDWPTAEASRQVAAD